jgi:hypothetical protein
MKLDIKCKTWYQFVCIHVTISGFLLFTNGQLLEFLDRED